MSVLDLPIERQRQMASEEGMTLEQWRKDVAESLERGRKFAEQCIANAIDPDSLSPEERKAEDRFQARVDDEELTNSVLRRRAEAESGKT